MKGLGATCSGDALRLVCALAALFLAGTAAADGSAVVRGTASYRERLALRPAVVPIRFEIPYDARAIDERHTYVVHARILAGGKLAFTTDAVAPVLTRGHGNDVELLLVRARGGVAPHAD